MKLCGPVWYLESRDKNEELEQEQKTLADLRIMCRMRPILDLIRIRQLNYLANLARLPDDRLEKIALQGHLTPEHAVGTSKAAPKNTVRNQYKKQLLSVLHLTPEELKATWLQDWEKSQSIFRVYEKGVQVAGCAGRRQNILEHL